MQRHSPGRYWGRIAILIVTYNRLSLLKECVAAIREQTHQAAGVIIVDNHSTDGTAEYLAGLEEDPFVRVITSEENLGGAGGFELGVGEALGKRKSSALCEADPVDFDWLILIDDDAMLEPDFIEKMEGAVASHPDHRLFAGAVKCDGRIDTNHRRNIKSRMIFSEEWISADRYDKPFTCDMATFCGLMISRDIMEKAGAPRGDYFIWYDDSEYCLRCEREAEALGYSGHIMVVPDAVIDHKSRPVEPEGDILMRTDWRSYYGWRNRYDVAKRYLGSITALVVKCEYIVLRAKSRMMARSKDETVKKQGEFNVKMITDVLTDISKNEFGVREEYQRS